jgi:hypothetical protein
MLLQQAYPVQPLAGGVVRGLADAPAAPGAPEGAGLGARLARGAPVPFPLAPER